MTDHLSKYFGIEEMKESLPEVQSEALDLDNDTEDAKQNIKNLIETGNKALEEALNLAIDSESPRAYEVLNAMLINLAIMNEKIIDLHSKKADIKRKSAQKSEGSNPSLTNNGSITNQNVVFTGTTKDLATFLENLKQENKGIIDVPVKKDGE